MAIILTAYMASSTLYMLIGTYILNNDPQSRVNRQFFGLCMCLFLWAFTSGMMQLTLEPSVAAEFRRYGTWFWSIFHTMMVQFMIVLTGNEKLIRDKWKRFALYIPCIVSIVIYFFLQPSGESEIMRTEWGWSYVNGPERGPLWTHYFTVYVISCSSISLGFLFNWRRRSTFTREKKQADIIIATFIAPLILGSATDVILPIVGIAYFPATAVVFISIPMIGIWRAMQKYRLMDLSTKTIVVDILGNIREGMMILDSNGCIREVNRGGRLLLGHDKSSIECADATDIFPDVNNMLGSENRDDYDGYALAADGSSIPVAVSCTPLNDSFGDNLGHLIIFQDITERRRLEENLKQRMEFQKFLTGIASSLINTPPESVDEVLNDALESAGRFAEVDRACLFKYDFEKHMIVNTHEWCEIGVSANIDGIDAVTFGILHDEIVDSHRKGSVVYIPDAEDLPESGELYRVLESQGIRSLMTVPLLNGDNCLGFIRFDAVRRVKCWSEDDVAILKIMAGLFANAYLRKDMQMELEEFHRELENRVEDRTRRLKVANSKLVDEVQYRIEIEKKVNLLAFYDQLTELPNRIMFNERLNQAIANASRNGMEFVVMLIDLDSFKRINDTLGHAHGDAILVEVARRISENVRKSDMVARVGGDEYLILLQNMEDRGEISRMVERILGCFVQPFNLCGREFYITASIGCAIYPEDGEDVETLVKNADIAMYNAKKTGKNMFSFCNPSLKDRVTKSLRVTNNLYHALSNGEFELHYQPQVNIETGRIIGLEALLRWDNPELGKVSPADMIPIAEKTGLIVPIGEWIIREACRANKKWQDMGLGEFTVAVNISVVQLQSDAIADHIVAALEESGLDSRYLELEVTESVMMSDAIGIIDKLTMLKSMGVMISIDDFGTEYSSFNHLIKMPVDKLKIDRSFIQGTESSEKGEVITKSIIQLARDLGINVIAEGVEKASQIEFLRACTCNEVQGYYYYRPMCEKGIEELLREKLQLEIDSAC